VAKALFTGLVSAPKSLMPEKTGNPTLVGYRSETGVNPAKLPLSTKFFER
jgi:hypothetical protein